MLYEKFNTSNITSPYWLFVVFLLVLIIDIYLLKTKFTKKISSGNIFKYLLINLAILIIPFVFVITVTLYFELKAVNNIINEAGG